MMKCLDNFGLDYFWKKIKSKIPTKPSDINAEPAFSKNSAFNKNFGTTAYSVCQGNDGRLSNARPANGGNADTVDGKHASDFLGASATATNSIKLGDRASIGYTLVDYIEPIINGTAYYGMCFTAYLNGAYYTQIFIAWTGNRFTRVVFNNAASPWQSF